MASPALKSRGPKKENPWNEVLGFIPLHPGIFRFCLYSVATMESTGAEHQITREVWWRLRELWSKVSQVCAVYRLVRGRKRGGGVGECLDIWK